MNRPVLFSFFLSIAILAGCAPGPGQIITPVLSFDDKLYGEFMEQKLQQISAVMNAVEERNLGVEKDLDWLSWAYTKLNIRKLHDIPPGSYKEYSKYLDSSRSVYISVHPSYYPFFHSGKMPVARDPFDIKEHIVDLFINEPPGNAVTRLLQEQQKNEKNFLEYLTMDEKLVILLLPRNYTAARGYAYSRHMDEYARYLNGIANGSPSIVYMESESASSGRLLSEDLILLISFLETIGAKSVLIGGGYVGRCQKEFYTYVTRYSFRSRYCIVPELSSFSPEDITETAAGGFLEDERLDLKASSAFVLSKTPGNTNIQHLPAQFVNAVLNVAGTNKRDNVLPSNSTTGQQTELQSDEMKIVHAR